ncbi:hypothetical protein CHLRE_09g400100v5 [Chlamydomonas reinhardtii]|uniref:Zinc finger protein n=1 Tax=Chlamydomonas reinhardtii TaxID=3055 RepID=A8J1F9_CHLRE|nr:uncharacterized protein CHLRE_09g400100v5 [Chlamydomonas reinhardtii]PNW78367.1 hypothetical protein CHLRE_09g400100v5 [Chlamydomonas reinhardtii]|eukprot:XP_001695200.1 zinc finger protein, major isoform [Chlamydomonas reinhardtii]
MEREQASSPQLCEKGCGFFANVGCGGMCSKCHREEARQHANAQATSSQPKPVEVAASRPVHESFPQPAAPSEAVASPVAEASTSSGDASPSATKSANPSRCLCCKKKVGLTGFKCKCGDVFCGTHRYAESHNCPFDYKTVHKEKLASNNPVVQASKVQKI